MKKALLIILVVISASNYSFGLSKDVEGWNKTQWGMTENEVLNVIEGKAIVIAKPYKYQGLSDEWDAYSPLVLDEIEIDKDKFTVDFIFDNKNKKLIKVIVSIKDKRPSELQFSSLEKMLTEEYGSPSFTKDDGKPDKSLGNEAVSEGRIFLERAWKFPSTIIELNYLNARAISSMSLKIIYKENLKETENVYNADNVKMFRK